MKVRETQRPKKDPRRDSQVTFVVHFVCQTIGGVRNQNLRTQTAEPRILKFLAATWYKHSYAGSLPVRKQPISNFTMNNVYPLSSIVNIPMKWAGLGSTRPYADPPGHSAASILCRVELFARHPTPAADPSGPPTQAHGFRLGPMGWSLWEGPLWAVLL